MNSSSSNVLPCKDTTPNLPSGVHGELVLAVDADIVSTLWDLLRKEARRGGYGLGLTLNYQVEWETDTQRSVSFEVSD